MSSRIVYCDDCGEYLGDSIDGILYKFGKRVTEEHICPNLPNVTLQRAPRYEVINRTTNQKAQASAFSADEACRKLGWMIGDCYVRKIGVG